MLRFFLLFCSLPFFWSCQKELSFETPVTPPTNPDSGAVFTLIASGNACSDASVSGSYTKGSPTNASNQVSISVDVSKKGDWSYQTGTVNGFAFTGAGSFSDTGIQTIILQASGTPAAAGNTSFPLNIGNANCSFSVAVSDGGDSVAAQYYYKATIDSVDYMQTVTEDNGYEAGSGLGGDDDVSFTASIDYASTPIPAGSTAMGVEKGIMHHYINSSNADFKAFFAPGDYPYTPGGSFDNGDGVNVSWRDKNGNDWDSNAGSADQTGSTFKIISVDDVFDAVGNYYIRVKMQFNCKLYQHDTGEMKELTNGEMVGLFGKI